MSHTTLHSYPEYIHSGDRLAATVWQHCSASQAAAASLKQDDTAIILRIANSSGRYVAIGYAPGGINA